MTDGLLRRVRARFVVVPLQRKDLAEAYAICGQNPVAYVMPAQHIEAAMESGRLRTGGLWGVRDRGERDNALVGVVWTGANLIPAIPDASLDTLHAVGDSLARRVSRPSALVGEAEVVHPLWERTERAWGPARSIRDPQHLMALSAPAREQRQAASGFALDPVRAATMDDFDYLLPAAVDMFRTEVGYDPLLHGRAAYEERLRWLIRSGRSLIQYGVVDGRRQIVFKAEVGVLSHGRGARGMDDGPGDGVAEIQGVWVHKLARKQGIARSGLAAVAAHIRSNLAPTVSLYVNDYNAPALRAYHALGFARVGTFVTVML